MKIQYAFALSTLAASVAVQPVIASDSTQDQTAGRRSESEVRFSKLMDANVASKSGENLGQLEDLIIDPQTGEIKYAILGRGGLLGIGEKYVPVPWKAIQVSSEKQFTLNVDKSKLKSAPTTDKSYSSLEQPGYDVTIYRFFEIPMGTGAAEAPGGSQQGQGSSANSSSSGQNK
jgi:sporulation protein YlmC with PRC-barrel domain